MKFSSGIRLVSVGCSLLLLISNLKSPALQQYYDLGGSSGDWLIPSDDAKIHVCLNNADFMPNSTSNAAALFTWAPTSIAQFQSILVLEASLRRHYKQQGVMDLVLLEDIRATSRMGDLERKKLSGWKVCQVDKTATASWHMLWGMTVYNRIIYLNDDAFLIQDDGINDLLQLNLRSSTMFASTRRNDDDAASPDDTLVVLQPNLQEYQNRLMMSGNNATTTDGMTFYTSDQWYELNTRYNAVVSTASKTLEEELWRNASIVHYDINTIQPWDCAADEPSCQPWLNVYHNDVYKTDALPCRNLDFEPTHKLAVFTMNDGNKELMENYIHGAVMLALSLQQHCPTLSFDLVLLDLVSKPVSAQYWPLLKSVGWKQCTVDRIPPPRDPMPQYRDQFTKLHTWQMTVYDSIVYMDSDTWAVGPVDDLLLADDETDQSIVAARDYILDATRQGWVDTFNMGVYKIRPNETEYNRLLALLKADTVDYEVILSEQGWLNVVYKDQWKELSPQYNANMLAVRNGQIKNVSVLHFTVPKSWYSCEARRFRVAKPFCNRWKAGLRNYTLAFYDKASYERVKDER